MRFSKKPSLQLPLEGSLSSTSGMKCCQWQLVQQCCCTNRRTPATICWHAASFLLLVERVCQGPDRTGVLIRFQMNLCKYTRPEKVICRSSPPARCCFYKTVQTYFTCSGFSQLLAPMEAPRRGLASSSLIQHWPTLTLLLPCCLTIQGGRKKKDKHTSTTPSPKLPMPMDGESF
jgi:hypothetical protein